MSSSGVNLESYLIPLEEIIRATKNFSQRIGDGGFGAVYKGQLSDRWQNRTVAIKRRDQNSLQGKHEFRNEIKMISKFHHENIISFIGYCDEGTEMIIVYEYAPNESLDHYLGDPKKMRCITWIQRLKICIGAAKGLNYLHSGLGEYNRVIHRDVKSANILLDGNFVAKICDFGLSRFGPRNHPYTEINTKVAGTHFYMDPTYQESRILRKESDVYSFGVVLFEMLSGTLVYREKNIGDHPQSLMNLVRRLEMEPYKLIDANIRDQVDTRSLETFKEIAYQCISYNFSERPTLDTVIKKIGEALIIQTTSVPSTFTPEAEAEYKIKGLIRKLKSGIPADEWTAAREISLLSKISVGNCIGFGKARAIPLLTTLLTASDSRTQEHAVTALCNLSIYKENIGMIVSCGGVPRIIYVLREGSMEARVNAAATLSSLCEIYRNKVIIGDEGAISPLTSLLSQGTQRGKKVAVTALYNLCLYHSNKERVARAGVIPILMELLREPEGVRVLKDEALTLLSILSTHREGMLAIGNAKVVPIMVEVIGSGSPNDKEIAASVLVELGSRDKKYLVEAQQHGILGKLTDLLQHGTDRGKEKAGQLLQSYVRL